MSASNKNAGEQMAMILKNVYNNIQDDEEEADTSRNTSEEDSREEEILDRIRQTTLNIGATLVGRSFEEKVERVKEQLRLDPDFQRLLITPEAELTRLQRRLAASEAESRRLQGNLAIEQYKRQILDLREQLAMENRRELNEMEEQLRGGTIITDDALRLKVAAREQTRLQANLAIEEYRRQILELREQLAMERRRELNEMAEHLRLELRVGTVIIDDTAELVHVMQRLKDAAREQKEEIRKRNKQSII